jgi:hypothetical protein
MDYRFLAVDFLAVDFLPVDFLAVDLFAVDFLPVDFLAVDLFAVDFFAVDFFAVDFLAVDLFAVDFFAVDFFAVDFLAVDLLGLVAITHLLSRSRAPCASGAVARPEQGKSGGHSFEAPALAFAHAAPYAVALVPSERIVETLDPNGTLGTDPLRLSRGPALLGEEDLRVVVPAARLFLPWDVVVHRTLLLRELHSCNSEGKRARLASPGFSTIPLDASQSESFRNCAQGSSR